MKNITESILSKSKLTNDDFIKHIYKTDLDIHREKEDNFDRITLDNIKGTNIIYNNIVNLDVDNLEDAGYHKNIMFRTYDNTFTLVFTGKKIQGFKFYTDKMRVFIGKDQEVLNCDFSGVEDIEFFFYDQKIKNHLLITHMDDRGNLKVDNTQLLSKMFHDNSYNHMGRLRTTRFFVGVKRDDYDYPAESQDTIAIVKSLGCKMDDLTLRYL